MGKKLTTEQFIEKAIAKHGNKYIYDEVDYKNSATKVKIICPIHLEFWQTPNRHLYCGCWQCGRDSTKITTEEYVKKANIIHNFKFDYSDTNYTGSKTNIIFNCPIHGKMSTRPDTHLLGTGCKKCGLELLSKTNTHTTEEVIRAFINTHGIKFNYDKVKYTGSDNKVEIYCNSCKNYFWQTPSSHIIGKGCLQCGQEKSLGFKRNDFIKKYKGGVCNLYVVKLFNKNESFIKIGITGNTIKKRFSNIPYEFSIIKLFKDFPDVVWDLEKDLHRNLKDFKYLPANNFGGQYECYTNDILNQSQLWEKLI